MVDLSACFNNTFFSFSKTHAGKVRPYNEDAILDMNKEGVWVVADGMGGHAAGNVASQIVVDTVQQCVEQTVENQFNVDVLNDALLNANEQVVDYAENHLGGKTAGSTVVILYIRDGFFHCLWVGDSRMYLMRDSDLKQKTRDHSQVMDMLEQGLISEPEAESHPQSNVITRAVGVNNELIIDQVSGQLLPGDTFLLCSDGLTKELTDKDLFKCMQAGNVSDSGLALMHSALVKGATDNVSCVLVKACHHEVNAEGQCDATVPIFLNRQ